MYVCKNCGLRYQTEDAVICVRCQAPRGNGNQFCPFCGNQMPPGGHICMNCGVDTLQYGVPISGKSKVAAGLLGIFLGYFGVHNFYLGYIKKGVIQLAGLIVSTILYFGIVIVMGTTENTSNVMGLLLAMCSMIGMAAIEIWGFVEGIMILCGKINKDGKGKLLKN